MKNKLTARISNFLRIKISYHKSLSVYYTERYKGHASEYAHHTTRDPVIPLVTCTHWWI